MAAYRTHVTGGGTSGTGNRTATIVPAVGDLLIALVAVSTNTNDTPSVTDDNGAGTYSRISVANYVDVPSTPDIDYRLSAHVRTALMVNTTSTVVTAVTGSNTSGSVIVIAVSGMARVGLNAIVQSLAVSQQAAAIPSISFGASCKTDNMTIGVVGNFGNPPTLTAPTNWTERGDTGQNTPPVGIESVTRDSGFTGTAVTWITQASATQWAGIVIELDASADTPLTPSVGSGLLTGFAPVLAFGTVLLAGALALTGIAPTVQQGGGGGDTSLTPAVGTLNVSGSPPGLGLAIRPPPGMLSIQGQTGTRIPRELTLLGYAPTVVQGTVTTPTAGALALTGAPPTGVQGTLLTPTVGAPTLAGIAPTVQTGGAGDTGLTPAAGALNLSGSPPGLDFAIRPDGGVLTLTGITPAEVLGTIVSPAQGALVASGVAPRLDLAMTPLAGAIALIGVAPTVQTGGPGNTALTPAAGALDLVCAAPMLDLATRPIVGALALTGAAGSRIQGTILTPLVGTLAISGDAGSLNEGIRPASGALTLAGGVPTVIKSGGPTGYYHTLFPATETPLSEGGVWINGLTDGLDWHDAITPQAGRVVGTQSGDDAPPERYGDTVALVTGTWGNDQTATAVVRSVNQQSGNVFEEVELRLRSTITPHSSTGYECLYRCTGPSISYVQIARWNGPLADFTALDSRAGPGLANGDVVKSTIVGTTIRTYINDVEIFSVNDATYASGLPGIGCFYQNDGSSTGSSDDFGFTEFTAWDSTHGPSVEPATGALAITGGTPSRVVGTVVIPTTGSLALTGQGASNDRGIRPSAGALALTGAIGSPIQGVVLTPAAGTLALNGAAPTLGLAITPGVGTLTLIGQSAQIGGTNQFTPATGALALTGAAPSLLTPTSLSVPAGTLTLNGVAPTTIRGTVLTPSAGSLALSGISPRLDLGIVPAQGALILTGQTPSVSTSAGAALTPGSGILALSGAAPGTSRGTWLTPTVGALALTPIAGVRVVGTWATPTVGALTLTGGTPSLGLSVWITPGTAALVLTGQQAFTAPRLMPGTGTLTLTGAAPTFGIAGLVMADLTILRPGTTTLTDWRSGVAAPLILRAGAADFALLED